MISNLYIAIVVLSFFMKNPKANVYTSLCRKQSDCGMNHCCALTKTTGKIGFCMPARPLGDLCTPSYTYGIGFVCGCSKGLTCALVEKSKNNIGKHRCVQVFPEAMEYDEKKIKSLLNTTRRYTASDLTRLLKLYRKPYMNRT